MKMCVCVYVVFQGSTKFSKRLKMAESRTTSLDGSMWRGRLSESRRQGKGSPFFLEDFIASISDSTNSESLERGAAGLIWRLCNADDASADAAA